LTGAFHFYNFRSIGHVLVKVSYKNKNKQFYFSTKSLPKMAIRITKKSKTKNDKWIILLTMSALFMVMISSPPTNSNGLFMVVSAEEDVIDMDDVVTEAAAVVEEGVDAVDEVAAEAEAAAAAVEAEAEAAAAAEEAERKIKEAEAAAEEAAAAAAKAAEEAAAAAAAEEAAAEAINSVMPGGDDDEDSSSSPSSPAVMAVVDKAKSQITSALDRIKNVSSKDAKKMAAGALGIWGAASVTGWAMQNIAGGAGVGDAAPKP